MIIIYRSRRGQDAPTADTNDTVYAGILHGGAWSGRVAATAAGKAAGPQGGPGGLCGLAADGYERVEMAERSRATLPVPRYEATVNNIEGANIAIPHFNKIKEQGKQY